MERIRKDDKVVILSGKDKGKRGLVLAVISKKSKVKVEGIGMVVRHYKARRRGEEPGIRRQESFIDISKVMLVDSVDDKPCRVGFMVNEQGTKVRVNRRTKSPLA